MQDPARPLLLPPQLPTKPEPGDCCGGGCVNCVYDVYETALERYESQLEEWKAHQRSPSAAEKQ